MITLAVVAGLIGAFVTGYLRGERNGIAAARLVGRTSVQRERARCGELVRTARLEEMARGRERCRTQVIQRLYGPTLIARPSAAGKN